MTEILVTSSQELSSDLKNGLEAKLQAKFGKSSVSYSVDPTLVLGLVVRAGDEEFYYNLRHEVSHILNELLS